MSDIIRPLTTSDTSAFKNLRLASLSQDPASWLATNEEEISQPDYYFSNKISYANTPPLFGYWGVFEDDKLVAYAQIASSFWHKKRHIATLYDVCVSTADRRKGLGSKLIDFIIQKAKLSGFIEQILLWVTSQNSDAISFYESLGFKKIATTPESVKEKDGSYQDEHLYVINLKYVN